VKDVGVIPAAVRSYRRFMKHAMVSFNECEFIILKESLSVRMKELAMHIDFNEIKKDAYEIELENVINLKEKLNKISSKIFNN
jgi:hypothetical protein